jgi:hypothetical protein
MTNTIQANFYVYVIYDPRPGKDDARVYVGKANNKQRPRKHLRKSHNVVVQRFIAHCRKLGLEPDVEIVAYFDNEADAFVFEIARIKKYGRRDLGTGTLYNLADGGMGATGSLAASNHMLELHNDLKFAKEQQGTRAQEPAEAQRRRKIQGGKCRALTQAQRCFMGGPGSSRGKRRA